MNIVNTLTLRHLKENKKRTVITVIGIIISVAMITATCVSVTSLFNVLEQETLYHSGNWHYNLPTATDEQIQTFSENQDLKYVALYRSMTGDLWSFDVHNSERASLGFGEIAAANRDYFDAFVTAPYTGTFPKDETEIFVSRPFLEKNNLDWKLGDTVTIELGQRFIQDESGEIFPYIGSFMVGEAFESSGTRTFTVVGIAEENAPTASAPILRGLATNETDGAEVYLTANALNRDTESLIQETVKQSGADTTDARFNKDLFRYKFIVRESDAFMSIMINFSCVILVVIMTVSVMLIYNAFGMSISERTRYLGMLASVGATKVQKRKSVYFEGLVLGLIGIPLGFLAGLAGMAVTFRLLQPAIRDSGLNISDSIHLTLAFPWWILPVIAALSAITIAVSAFIPAHKASRTTPIDALRQNTDVKVKAKKLRSPKIIRKVFGYEGELAYKNMKRNGKKSRVITGSLVLSVVLFLSVNTFCSMFSQANSMESAIPYQVYVTLASEEEAKFREEAAQLDNIDAMYCVKNLYIRETKADAAHYKNGYDKIYGEKGFSLFLNLVDDADFNALCTENGIDYHTFYQNNFTILLMNDADRKTNSAKVFDGSIVGTALQSAYDAYSENGFTVGGLIDYRNSGSYCYALNSPGTITAFMPKSVAEQIADSSETSVGFETENPEQLSEDISLLLENGGYQFSRAYNLSEQMKMMNSTIFIMQVFIYGFIALMTLISVANIFNTVSTSIDLRRKEFAMLKSVGVTPKGFRRMLRFESLFYGLKALVYGLPLSIGISFVMWKILTDGNVSMPFHLDWRIYLGVVVAVFLIVGASMLYSTSKVKKDSIIETLKTEIN